MGTEVHCKSSFERYYSMRDVNEDSNSSSWPLFYGDNKALTNGHYYNGFVPRTVADAYPGCDKEAIKQKMLEHEAIFKNQVFELHRLYRRQRDMMEEVKRKEYHKHRMSVDASSSQASYRHKGLTKRCCSKENNSIKDSEGVEGRPSKVRKKLFDLELPPDDNVDHDEQRNAIKQPPTGEYFEKAQNGRANGAINHSLLEGKSNGRDWLSNMRETGNSRSNMNFTPGTYTDHSRFNQTSLPFPPSRTNASYPHNATDWLILATSKCSFNNKLTFVSEATAFLSSHKATGCMVTGRKKWINRNKLEDMHIGFFKRFSNFIDLTGSNKGIDLNDDSNTERKCDKTVPPWLQNKPVICNKDSRLDNCVENNGKILGNPVFGNSCVSKNESSSLVSTSASLRCLDNGKIKMETENRGFDMNVAWDDPENKQIDVEDVNLKKETDKIKNHFDLNSCLTEDDDLIVRESDKSSSEKMKTITMDIDLEAPAVPEAEEEETINEVKKIDDFDYESVEKMAAEAMVAMIGISNQQDQVGSTSEVAVCSDDNDNENDKGRLLLLVLRQLKTPPRGPYLTIGRIRRADFATEDDKENTCQRRSSRCFRSPGAGSTRPSKRSSEARHRGLTRRNGTRGRRKSVAVAVEPPPAAIPPPPLPPPPPSAPPLSEQLNNMEAVGLDERSLTGWGKTTRRPRATCAAREVKQSLGKADLWLLLRVKIVVGICHCTCC
ncbi:actin-binding FH2 [Tanacetum coccineum]